MATVAGYEALPSSGTMVMKNGPVITARVVLLKVRAAAKSLVVENCILAEFDVVMWKIVK